MTGGWGAGPKFGEIWFVSSALEGFSCLHSSSARSLSVQRLMLGESSVVLTGSHRACSCPGLGGNSGLDCTVPLSSEARIQGGKLPISGLLCTRHCVCILEKEILGHPQIWAGTEERPLNPTRSCPTASRMTFLLSDPEILLTGSQTLRVTWASPWGISLHPHLQGE